jgi:preprotein translocase subunit SecG
MDNVLLVAYLLIVLAMIAVILIQRSEGGGLGMGGGSNNFMTTRGSANVLTRTTAILATLFFVLAIGLTVVKSIDKGSTSILDSAAQSLDAQTGTDQTTPANVLDALNQLQRQTSGESPTEDTTTDTAPAPTDTAPATTAPATDSPSLAVPDAPASEGTSGN